MLQPDHEIRRLCKQNGMISPFTEAMINPASIDVRLGDRIMVEQEQTPDLQILGISEYNQDNPFLIEAGEWLLAETQEILHLPDFLGAQFVLKSSRAREGWDHAEAGWADPGYCGRLTLELRNSRQYHPLPIWPGMRIGQLKFMLISGVPERSYAQTGRYQHDLVVTASKG
jgi:dCTP deaminase